MRFMAKQISTVRFLIVEDHGFQRLMLEQALRSLGAETVRQAGNGAEAVRILREEGTAIDVVISDVKMPEVDGIELIPMLRKFAEGASLLLASSEQWTLEVGQALAKAHKVPLLAVVLKPLTPEKLRPVLEAYVAGPAGPTIAP